MNKKERLMLAIGEADEKYIKEAESSMNAGLIKVAAVLAVIIALSLYLFIPFAPVTSDLSDYQDSAYFPLIEGIEDYRLQFLQPKYKNNFQSIAAAVAGLFTFKGALGGDMPNFDADMSPTPENGMSGNGSYVENTDNQVGGVIEGDLMKMTDKYIFRYTGSHLFVFSIEKENSELVGLFEVPTFQAEYRASGEMYLSSDGNTITIMKQIFDKNSKAGVGIISIDVSDIKNIKLRGMMSIDGEYNTSRMVDGKLLLITNYTFNRNGLDYDSPETFVPTIDSGNGAEPIRFEDIIYPENVDGTDYSVVALIDTDNLALLGANALLNFTDEVYVSAENIFVSREYTSKTQGEDTITSSNMSDIAVLGYSEGTLTEKGVITLKGHTEDQYSFDELDGYLRVVTTTLEITETTMPSGYISRTVGPRNVSLYIVDLKDNSVAYSLESFAIEGEEATAVRFDGDKVYVCTAVVVTFTDPVYFIDLSDYESITSADTGIIEGYSDHLINYGEGLTLGIGRENWQYSKVEIYAQQGDKVVSIHEYKFNGEYSLDYKSYLVNRENNLFGFAVEYFYEYDENGKPVQYSDKYILISFDEQSMQVRYIDIVELGDILPYRIRAAYIDGYIYITTDDSDLVVEKIN